MSKYLVDNWKKLGVFPALFPDMMKPKCVGELKNLVKNHKILGVVPNKIDTSEIKSTARLFVGIPHFNEPIGKWEMGNVTDTSHMFAGAKDFNQYIGDWGSCKDHFWQVWKK